MDQNNTPFEDPNEIVILNMQVLGGLITAFPFWMQKFYNLFEKTGHVNLAKFYQSLREDELMDILTHFKLTQVQGDNEHACKTIALFTMLNMLAQGVMITKSNWAERQVNVAGMVMSTYIDKTEQGTANFDKFDIEGDPNLYVVFNKPDNLTGEIHAG